MKTCSICQKEFTEFGNNAQPINDGRCCDDCDNRFVIPMRAFIMLMRRPNDELDDFTEKLLKVLPWMAKLGRTLIDTRLMEKDRG